MLRTFLSFCLLAQVSALAYSGGIALDCGASSVDTSTPGRSAIVERDATSIVVETDLWVSLWRIENRSTVGFQAHLVNTDWKSVSTYAPVYEHLRDIESLSLIMTGPDGGFKSGQRYVCAMSQTLPIASR